MPGRTNLHSRGIVDGDDVSALDRNDDGLTDLVRLHDADLDTADTLLELKVADSLINVVVGVGTGLDHVAFTELHSLSTSSTELTGDDDLNTGSLVLHDLADDTVASAADGDTVGELEVDGLSLCNSGESTVADVLSIELNILDTPAGLDESSQLADAATLLTDDGLGAGSADDDGGRSRGAANLDTSVTLRTEDAGEELVQFSIEDTVSNELALLGDEARHICWMMEGGGKRVP